MIDECIIVTNNGLETLKTGISLASSLYHFPITISLTGQLGSGKTTFAKGFARGLGIKTPVISPTFALEQRYGSQLLHIDLYRLKSHETTEILHHSENFPGIRLIEWADKSPMSLSPDISVKIDELSEDQSRRTISIRFSDIKIPSQKEIETWRNEVSLPRHIIKHTEVVANVCVKLTPSIWENGIVIRKKATIAAAKTHDLLRFVDFKDFKTANNNSEVCKWTSLKNKYPGIHEIAACNFLKDKGYPEIGEIIKTHRGYAKIRGLKPVTNEQFLLSYADKRVLLDRIVSLDERFSDFAKRYNDGKRTSFAIAWHAQVKQTEISLFSSSPPDLTA